jgi:polyisoprenoid-binding protein YceI
VVGVTSGRRNFQNMRLRQSTLLLFTLVLGSISAEAADRACVVTDRSHFRIQVGSSGLFSAFGHDHLIEATKIEGCASIDPKDLAHSSITLTFPTADIRVLDPKEAKDRPEVQKTMETEVLEVSRYPQVKFESTGVDGPATGQQLRVRGNLTIHGKTLPVVIPITFMQQGEGIYRAVGKFAFKQSSFGIKPVRVAGGTIKVKDEVETEFEIFLK